MDDLGTDAKRRIIKLLFPDLRYGGDPDVERYFESRKEGRVGQALAIYNGSLRVRYPDDSQRIELLRLYRENDPRYSAFQEKLLLDFASRLSTRIRGNIDLIIAPLERADLSDALRALKAVESILSRLPGETGGASGALARYSEFAQAIDYRQALVRKALELVREYDAVSRADSPADYDFVARSAAIEERRRASAGARTSEGDRGAEESYDFVSKSAELEARRKRGSGGFFDPSRIKFTAAERAAVEIPADISRREDKVIAFCAKYWSRTADQGFERTIFLYSRKYGGRHFEVFRAIKLARARGASDDEMLSAVSAILTTSYSYSVSGDLYMQVMWRRIRARMEAQALAERLSAPGPESRVRTRRDEPISRVRATERGAETLRIPPPAAGDEEPTRFGRRLGENSSPPSFALRATAGRGQVAKARDAAIAAARDSGVRPAAPGKKRGRPAAEVRREAQPPSVESAQKGRGETAARAVAPTAARAAARAATLVAAKSGGAEKAARGRPAKAAPGATSKAPAYAAAEAAQASSYRSSPKTKGSPSPEPSLRPAPKRSRSANPLGRAPAGPEPIREIRAKRGSISDTIRKLSGKTYDVYKDIFLEKVRDVIHKTLLANQTKSHGLFDTAANEAEDQIFGFISNHYDDPFMDWEHSAERELVETLGFSIPSLTPIIETCFRKL